MRNCDELSARRGSYTLALIDLPRSVRALKRAAAAAAADAVCARNYVTD